MGHSHEHDNTRASGNIGTAFVLNLVFAAVDLAGGILTGSVAIMADALHDFGDSLTLGLAWFLQKISSRGRSDTYTYGYGRLSLLSSLITGLVLFAGSVVILIQAVPRLWSPPSELHGWGMMGLSVFGIAVNGFAAFRLRRGATRNEKMLSWHLIEDVLGWAAVLIGSVVILLTGWGWVDAALAFGIAIFIGYNVITNLWETVSLFLQRTPENFEISAFAAELRSIPGVVDVHDVHVWTLDGARNILSLHVDVAEREMSLSELGTLKRSIRAKASRLGHFHTTIEIESSETPCLEEAD